MKIILVRFMPRFVTFDNAKTSTLKGHTGAQLQKKCTKLNLKKESYTKTCIDEATQLRTRQFGALDADLSEAFLRVSYLLCNHKWKHVIRINLRV